MNTKTNRKTGRRSRLLSYLFPSALAVFATSLYAQDSGDAEVIELSPFSVNSQDQDGYLTKSTTAGTRLRTNVKDLGAQIDIFSKDFLEDIGASDLDIVYDLRFLGDCIFGYLVRP